MTERVQRVIFLVLPILLIMFVTLINDLSFINVYLRVILIFATFLISIFSFLYGKKLPQILYKLFLIVSFLIPIALGGYAFLYNNDLIKYLSSITAIKELIISTGAIGSFVFIFIQIAQVVFLPIPAVALLVVGIVVYGPIKAAIYCIIGVLLGSYIAFLVGKTFGLKFASWFFGEDKVLKYTNILKSNGKYILSLIFIFPFFPDDMFCMLAGISPMSFKEFFLITTLVRPISIIVMCMFGGASLFSLNNPIGIILLLIFVLLIIIFAIIIIKKNKKQIKSLFHK